MSFYICHCGYPENNHLFRHRFEKLIKVENKDNCFTIDVNDYPTKIHSVCGFPQCGVQKSLHQILFTKDLDTETKVTHDFVPNEKKYREVNFSLPEDSVCYSCQNKLYEHRDNNDKNNSDVIKLNFNPHRFVAKIVFLNKTDLDNIKVFDETRDMKIIVV